MTHAFDAAIAVEQVEEGRFRGRTHEDFYNLVGPFGGITAATIVHALQSDPRTHGRPVAVTMNFTAPLADGEFDIVIDPVRTNNTNQHWTLRIEQNGQVPLIGTALFVVNRDSFSALEAQPPQAGAPEGYPLVTSAMLPPWSANYDLRIVAGAVPRGPAQAVEDSTATFWIGQKPARAWDYPALAAACDTFPPRVYQRLGKPVPAGTITLTIYFHADDSMLRIQDNDILGTVGCTQFIDGFADQEAQIWGFDRSLLATSTQLCYFKAAPQ